MNDGVCRNRGPLLLYLIFGTRNAFRGEGTVTVQSPSDTTLHISAAPFLHITEIILLFSLSDPLSVCQVFLLPYKAKNKEETPEPNHLEPPGRCALSYSEMAFCWRHPGCPSCKSPDESSLSLTCCSSIRALCS